LAAWRFFFFASHTLKPGFGGLFESDGPPTALGRTQLGGGGVRKQRGAPGYCQLSPPLYYFAAVANSAGNAAVDLRFWQSVPPKGSFAGAGRRIVQDSAAEYQQTEVAPARNMKAETFRDNPMAQMAGSFVCGFVQWESMYLQYIIGHSCEEVVSHSIAALQGPRNQRLSVEEVAKLPHVFTQIFVFDLFQACFASCQHKNLSCIAMYADRSKTFS